MEKSFLGKWRITEMEQWDQEYIDLVAPGYFKFGGDRLGHFQFGAVQANIDYRIEKCGKEQRIEFSFEGEDEGDSISGRGWATAAGDELKGRLYSHLSDDSWFKAQKT